MVNLVFVNGSGHKEARPVTSREEYVALRNAAANVKNFYDARGGNESAKAQQIQFCYNDLLPDGVLKGCKHPSSTFAHDIDCGNEKEQALIRDELLRKKDEIGLLELSGSARWGLHAVCRRQPERTIRECQYALSMATKTEYDTNARGLARVMYTGPATADNLFYLDDAIFEESLTVEESAAEYERLKARERQNQEEVSPEAKKANKHYRPWEDMDDGRGKMDDGRGKMEDGRGKIDDGRGKMEDVASQTSDIKHQPSDIKHQPSDIKQQPSALDPRNLVAFDLCAEQAGLNPNAMDVWGEHNWHANLMAVLSIGVGKLMTRGQLYAVVAQRMPNYAGTEDCRKLIDYFYEKYDADKGFMNASLREINARSQQERTHQETPLLSSLPPEMPAKLPKLIQLLLSKTPEVYKPAVAHAVFPALATHLCQVRFCYTDNVEHEATLMNCLMAGTGAGKGCIDKPIERIMADIKRRDEENERREAEWKKDCQKKGANKDKMLRPEGLVIQIIDPDMTKPALVMRMDEAEGHFVYVKLNELDLFDQLKGQNGKQHFQLMCLAFDSDATYGQTRIGTQSVTARPMCRFNWNACTTILKGRRYFRNVLTDGPISRINFCTIPDQEIGAEQPVYGRYDAAFDEALKPYIDNLVAARGLIDCQQAFKLAQKLQQACIETAQLNQNMTYWNLSHRAVVIAWLKACVLYVANGRKWEKSIDDFIRWSLDYDMFCKMAFFGNRIEAANNDEDSRIGTRGPQNLLTFLPDVFTVDDAKRVRQQQGLGVELTNQMIRTWKSRKYVLQISDFSFQKADRFRSLK